MSSKVLTLLLSLAAQSGARPTGPRAIAEISTALVLLNAPSRAWAFVKYSPGSDNVCGELCEWDAIAYRDEDDNPPSNPPSCGDRITFVINQEGKPALEACAQVAAEFPDICGMCEPIIPTDDWTDEPTPTPTAGPMPAPTIPRDACGEPCNRIGLMPWRSSSTANPTASMRASCVRRPLFLLSLRAIYHPHLQLYYAWNLKITITGTAINGGPLYISAPIPRPTASEGP